MAPPGERGAAPGGGCGAGAFWGNFCGIWGSLRSGAAVWFRQGLGLVPAGGFGVIPARFGVDFGREGFWVDFGRVWVWLREGVFGFGFGRFGVWFRQGLGLLSAGCRGFISASCFGSISGGFLG